MDISNAIVAKSDQLNAIDLAGSPVTVAVVTVKDTSGTDQPVSIVTDVFGDKRPFKPSKTVLRILALAWGKETTAWTGHRMELFRDPSVRWAGEEVGGIRIKGLSHIEKPMTFNLPTSKGKHAKSTVAVLPDAAPTPAPTEPTAELIEQWVAAFNDAPDIGNLQILWGQAGTAGVAKNADILAAKDKRKGELA